MKLLIQKIRNQYFYSFRQSTLTFAYTSFAINLIIGVGKLLLGFFYASFWFTITAIYYIALCFARGQILHKINVISKNLNADTAYVKHLSIYRKSGLFVVFIGISYFAVCMWMLLYNETIKYPQYILYGVAAIAFYKISVALRGLIIAKKQNNLALSAIKIINFLDACVSIVFIQCALLVSENSSFASSSSATLGIVVSIIFCVIGIFMLSKKARKCG